uniref:Uncharacterized protein n=1 Tax=Magnaporthe oryzae polymycovirus 2 TaxID=2838331 RepID=A0A8E6Z559_9VIRU|nr:hypothetical protein [Magnaporthe oryzae polymycovirus 2]
MSLSSAFNSDVLSRLANLSLDDLKTVHGAVTHGYTAGTFFEALQAHKQGRDPELPSIRVQPRPLVINAWSFVNDRAQYNGVYGLSAAEATDLREQILSDRKAGFERIEKIVGDRLRQKGSNKGVSVSEAGMPGESSGPGAGDRSPVARELKKEIAAHGARYGRYKFVASETVLGGPHAFVVNLGGGFGAYFANKRGAIDVARIARVQGREFELIQGYVGFLPPGETNPQFGKAINPKATWDCKLGPDDKAPPAPTPKATTAAPPK